MLHRVTDWLIKRSISVALWACTIVPALGWIYNTVDPPESYGYLSELALLVLFGLAALWLSRDAPEVAVTLYYSAALLPVAAMVQYQQAHEGGWTALIVFPFAGVFIVSLLTHHTWGTIAYTVAASLAGFVIGLLYNDVGGAVGLLFITGFTGAIMARGCARHVTKEQAEAARAVKEQLERACADVEGVQRGLKKITGALGHVSKRE